MTDDLNSRVMGLVRCWESRRRKLHESIALDLADDLASDVSEDVAWLRYERRCKANGISVRRPKPTMRAAMFLISAGLFSGIMLVLAKAVL